jgi:DNA adenine methylase
MTTELRPVQPARPAAPYIGGKKHLAEFIARRIAAVPHRVYAEPFVGMGGVFLRRDRRPAVEAVNDRSRDVATFFRVLQRHYVAFLDMLRFQLSTRAEFDRLKATDPETLTDLERAARFLYLQRLAYAGRREGHFAVTIAPARFDVTRLGTILEELHMRLAGVVIECLDFEDFIGRYDTPETLFYCDPPYMGSENDYGRNMFARQDFARLAFALAPLKGRFILSLNDTPEIRDTFAGFAFEEVRLTYTAATHNGAPARELLISDRPLEGDLFSRPQTA